MSSSGAKTPATPTDGAASADKLKTSKARISGIKDNSLSSPSVVSADSLGQKHRDKKEINGDDKSPTKRKFVASDRRSVTSKNTDKGDVPDIKKKSVDTAGTKKKSSRQRFSITLSDDEDDDDWE